MNYLVSILVPVYGVEQFIEKCAVSLFEQTYDNIEYIFVNDCSKDNSIGKLKKIIEQYPSRKAFVKIINHKKNKGLAGSRNTAIKFATGDFVMHVDSDDYVDKDIVAKAVKCQIQSDADIVIIDFLKAYPTFSQTTHYQSFDNPKDYCLTVLERNNSNSIWAKLIRRNLYESYNIKCKEGCNQGEDYQVVPILLYYAKKIVNLKEPLYYYECSNENAYSNSFTIDKHNQNWESMNLVRDFFVDKGIEYNSAVNCGRVRQIADDLIISAKSKGEVSDCYYNYAIKNLKEIGKKYWSKVPIAKRVILYLSSHYIIMKTYILVLRKIRHTVLMLKSRY